LPCAIWVEAVAMLSLLLRTWPTMPASLSRMRAIAAITLVLSPAATGTWIARSPSATALAIAATSAGSPPVAAHTDLRAQTPSATSSAAERANRMACARLRFDCVAASVAIAASANEVDTLTVSSTPARCSP
jgi:hypothetical protein